MTNYSLKLILLFNFIVKKLIKNVQNFKVRAFCFVVVPTALGTRDGALVSRAAESESESESESAGVGSFGRSWSWSRSRQNYTDSDSG